MSIIRVRKDEKYFTASNEPFVDEKISWEARGLMGYLLTKPNNWEVRTADLTKKGPAKEHKIRRMLAELRKAGYMNRIRITLPGGKFDWVTEVYESPIQNPKKTSGGFSTSGSATRGKMPDIVSTDSTSTENSIEGEADKKPTVPEGFPIEWLIAHGNPVDQAQIDKLVNAKAACDKFEQVFAFHSLPWSVNGPWERFEKWVVKIYTDYPTLFQEYVDWRRDQGKYKAMSNKQIRTNPLMFIDTGYPEFEAAKMYADKPTRKGSGKQSLQDVQADLREWLEEKGETISG